MSITPQVTAVVQPIRRRRRRRSVEIAAARDAWRSSTIAAGLRCDRCGDAACVIVDERRFCSDCFLVNSVRTVGDAAYPNGTGIPPGQTDVAADQAPIEWKHGN
jgi:hypothetical protein